MRKVVWKEYSSVTQLSEGLWEEKVAQGDLTRKKELLEIIENTLPYRKFLYLVALYEGNTVGIVFFTFFDQDDTSYMQSFIKRAVVNIRKFIPGFMISKIAMTGTRETTGNHWWYDSSFWSWNEFVLQIMQELKRYNSLYEIIIFRDFEPEEKKNTLPEEVNKLFKILNFVEINELPAAKIIIPQKLYSEEDFLLLLKGKDRYTIRKALKKVEACGLQVVETDSLSEYLEELYPLYLETNKRAKEYKTEPLNKKFFEYLTQKTELNTHFIGIKNCKGRLISFIISFENNCILYPFFIGMDYDVNREMHLIYITLWMTIKRAIEKGHVCIEMGVSNYFIKERFGAIKFPMKMFIRLKSPLMNVLSKKYLYKKLNIDIM